MSDVPVQVVVAAFQEEKAADEALFQLKQAKWAGAIGIQDAAVLRKDQKGKMHIKETGDWGGGKGAAAGAVVGGFIGLLAGPIGWLGLTGAVIGGLAAKLRDSGFSDERLKQIGGSLQPGTSAIIAVIEHKWVAELERQMAEAGADVMTEEIGADMAQYNGYEVGNAWNVINYECSGTTCDWMYGDQGILSVCIEVGGSHFWPQESELPGLVAENLWPQQYKATEVQTLDHPWPGQ